MKKSRYIYGVLCIVMVALLWGCGTKNGEDDTTGLPRKQETEKAQDTEEEAAGSGVVFEAQDMEGNGVSQDVFSKSRLTMVNVWATYCNPCLKEMPSLGELAGEYDGADFQLIGVVSDVMEGQEALGQAADLIEETGASYPHLLLNESLYFGLLADVTAVPTTFFIDQNGVVLDVVVGAMDKEAWKEKIDGLLENL